jgi:hypothetical protein
MKKMTASYAVEIVAHGEDQWCGGGLRLGTRAEAEAYGRDLARRWTAVKETRVVESEDAPNYGLLGGRQGARA